MVADKHILPGSHTTAVERGRLQQFVKESTINFDSSHNHEHAQAVLDNLLVIIGYYCLHPSLFFEGRLPFVFEEDIAIYAALLHDVRDDKYKDLSISEQALTDFLVAEVGVNKCQRIMKICDQVSWSKESRGMVPRSTDLWKPAMTHDEMVLVFLRDADRLEALGAIGIERCIAVTHKLGGKVPEDVIQHCHDKLLRLNGDEKFIFTPIARQMGAPGHRVIEEYCSRLHS